MSKGEPKRGVVEANEITLEHRTHSNTREEFEYIVIGPGAGGGRVAANLAKAGRRVSVWLAATVTIHVRSSNTRYLEASTERSRTRIAGLSRRIANNNIHVAFGSLAKLIRVV